MDLPHLQRHADSRAVKGAASFQPPTPHRAQRPVRNWHACRLATAWPKNKSRVSRNAVEGLRGVAGDARSASLRLAVSQCVPPACARRQGARGSYPRRRRGKRDACDTAGEDACATGALGARDGVCAPPAQPVVGGWKLAAPLGNLRFIPRQTITLACSFSHADGGVRRAATRCSGLCRSRSFLRRASARRGTRWFARWFSRSPGSCR